ncbi:MAG TPA: hypothetical protein VH637_15200 [Streptosporangiaceae bacterium]|jgi:hypothetical protein
MLLLFGKNPVFRILAGVVLLVIGLVLGKLLLIAAGAVVLVLTGARALTGRGSGAIGGRGGSRYLR